MSIARESKVGEAAFHGPIGKFINELSPHTEASEAGILAHLIPAIGSIIGSGPYVFAGSHQPARVNVAVVGPTSRGRKGTSAAPVDLCFKNVDTDYWNAQRVSGLSSGEGLIVKVADKWEKDEEGNSERVPVEKRLYVVEPEFSRVLANIRREGNILSQILREAYDSGNLSTLTVNPREAVGAHISVVAHVTPEELTERLSHIEMANGFGNRFLWFYVESDKLIPHIPEGGKAGKIRLANHRLWRPTLGQKIDLLDVEQHILELDKKFGLEFVGFDPWQAEHLAQSLEADTDRQRRSHRKFYNEPWLRELAPVAANLRQQASLTIEFFQDGRLELFDCEPLRRDLHKLRIVEKSYGFRLESPRDGEGHGDSASAFTLALLLGHELAGKEPVVIAPLGANNLLGDDYLAQFEWRKQEYAAEQEALGQESYLEGLLDALDSGQARIT